MYIRNDRTCKGVSVWAHICKQRGTGEWKQPLSQKGAYVSENAKGKC